ncbi:unnamed protein product [Thlaspi arvense]|uniref:Transcriptional regulator of RNA polII, SAGA, subunit n=1 Tax=Thlaspi arvense TaxID=13288 RepID=A0AAU9RVA8_THLAR|nr:unnamed protein product [Thlaspi arvense]
MGSKSDQSLPRLNTLEIKALIYQKIGHSRANTYFNHLGKFLTSRIGKSEFDNLCIKTIGKEHILLHNRLIHSILKNATVAKSPPPRYLLKKPGNSPPSPRKCRSRKLRDRPSPLGPLGTPQSITTTNDESASKVRRLASVEDGEEVEQMNVQSIRRSSLTAPLGVSINGARNRKSSSLRVNGCERSSELPDTNTLRTRLERKLEMEGMKLSMESANVLNIGLDAFMRRLIEPCLSLASSRGRQKPASMLDFLAAVELNPQVLGKDWPIQLEKVCSRASDE